ncbi:MAG TPA: hypothetical protein VFN56_04620 [Candidatus Saccharimonadales bacterium]|nr:hypothetical protein [Candidatus Saccharimonadales bacterium]
MQKITSWVKSPRFIWVIVGTFIVESFWIAISGRYPMAFDEDFHLGIIRIYAHHLSPFFAHQPSNANSFGAVARDPSYLYHYLMSFPYRLTTYLTSSTTTQILILRFIDIVLFSLGLWLFNKVLRKTNAPVSWVNLSLLFFILIPVVPQLAAQINYDNLFIPLVALSLLLTINIREEMHRKDILNLKLTFSLLVLCLLTSLVKYAFLPIFLAILVYLLLDIVIKHKWDISSVITFLIWSIKNTRKRFIVAGIFLVIASGGLFFERYGINFIRYHTPIPACDRVLSIPECSSYGPWERDYLYKQYKGTVNPNQIRFTADWFYGLFERSFFAVNGPQSNFATDPALPIIAITAALSGIVGVILFIYFRKTIVLSTKHMIFLLSVSIAYAAALWYQNYTDFLKVGQPVAINGRYVFPILLPILLAIALGYRELFKSHFQLRNIILLTYFAIIILEGGGALTFIIRSDASWYWPNDHYITTMNNAVSNIMKPIVLH